MNEKLVLMCILFYFYTTNICIGMYTLKLLKNSYKIDIFKMFVVVIGQVGPVEEAAHLNVLYICGLSRRGHYSCFVVLGCSNGGFLSLHYCKIIFVLGINTLSHRTNKVTWGPVLYNA